MGTAKNKKLLAVSVLGIGLATILGLAFLAQSNSRPVEHLATAKFLAGKFIDGKYLEGFTPGLPEYGFSLEAISQLSYASDIDISQAKKYLLEKEWEYLFSPETKTLLPGLAGKFLFTSKVTGVNNPDLVEKLKSNLEALIEDGRLASEYGTFDYAWVTLGLFSQGEADLATEVATYLAQQANSDGGFGLDQSEQGSGSTVDATAMAVLALALTEETDQSNAYIRTSAKAKAIDFLLSKLGEESHFVAYDEVDVNGTALAFMAFEATKNKASEKLRAWLIEQIRDDGGIGSPWVEIEGDVFATAQGYLALEGATYLDLLR